MMKNKFKIILVLLLTIIALEQSNAEQILDSERTHACVSMGSKTFLYFSYGSNMKSERIHKNNPSAKQKTVGRIEDHRLDFWKYSDNWHGCSATIVPSKSSETWGVVWEIDLADLPNLDKQEGVAEGVYFVKNVTVQTVNGDEFECRTYQQTDLPEDYIQPNELPPERQPSLVYMNTIIGGAKEFSIPTFYVHFLESFRHNNYNGPVEIPRVNVREHNLQ